MEFIFLVDRSGSMDGDRIEMTKSVLNELLDRIPIDSYFNIVSFGSYYELMYLNSCKNDKSTILDAKV